jgi:hypothetical protein
VAGPPPLRPFGLVLHHDGSWTHEGHPILHAGLRAHFDRSVRFLPDEGRYVVVLRHFRGQVEVEEAAFFVREAEAASGRIVLSDGSTERLDVASLRPSPRDGAWLASVKGSLAPGGLPARFTHAAQAMLLEAAEERDGVPGLCVAGRFEPLPEAVRS